MNVKLNVRNIDLRGTQERVDNNVRQLRTVSRKAVLAYAGLWGLAYDEARTLLERGQSLIDRAEDRGENLELEATHRVRTARDQASRRLRKVEQTVESARSKVISRTETVESELEQDIETQVERVLSRLGIPSRERIVRLSNEIETLSKKIDKQLAREIRIQPAVVEQRVELDNSDAGDIAVAEYDTLNVKEVLEATEELSIRELELVREYEQKHQNRVTVVRALTVRIEAMPIENYDERSVDELENELSVLSQDQLVYIREYELSHQNRVTLLRTIESKLGQFETA